MGETTSADATRGDRAHAILDLLARRTPRAVAAVAPELVDGHMVDGTVVWMTQLARAFAPDVQVGTRVGEIISGTFRLRQTVLVSEEAIAHPGTPVSRGPYTVLLEGAEHHFQVSAVFEDGLLLVEYADVTEAVQSRRQREETQHDFRALMDGLEAGVVVLRPVLGPDGGVADATITWSNVASRAMWLNQDGLAPGTKVSDVYYDQADWLASANEAWQGVTTYRVLDANPEVAHWTSATETIRRVGDHLVEITFDRTQEARVRDRLAAGDRLETLGRTAGSIAHDFNNLLMIVTGSIDRARRQVGESLPLDTAAAAAGRAAALAGSLLGFARGRPGAPERLTVGPLFRSLGPILRGVTHPRVALVIEVDDPDAQVLADRTHVEQVVLNLVTNARDAAPSGSRVHVRVQVVERADCHLMDDPAPGRYVAITVTDHGGGVPPAIASRIWEPFFSGKPATDESGTGLGLATVHGTVHQYDGHVHLDSPAGGPTTFSVYFPLCPTEATAALLPR